MQESAYSSQEQNQQQIDLEHEAEYVRELLEPENGELQQPESNVYVSTAHQFFNAKLSLLQTDDGQNQAVANEELAAEALEEQELEGEQQDGYGQEIINTDEDEEEDDFDDSNPPLLFVDVNLGANEQQRIVVYEGDTAQELAEKFCQEHDLDDETQKNLEALLEQQISSVLTKIDENEEDADSYTSN